MTLPTDPRDDSAHIPHQSAPPAGPRPSPPAVPPRKRRRWPLIAAAAAVVLAAAGGAAYALMPTDDDEAGDRCQAAITGKLKSPSTAQWGERTVSSSEGDFGTYYEVTGELDAQNGFGATVRLSYFCRVQHQNDGEWLVTESTATQR